MSLPLPPCSRVCVRVRSSYRPRTFSDAKVDPVVVRAVRPGLRRLRSCPGRCLPPCPLRQLASPGMLRSCPGRCLPRTPLPLRQLASPEVRHGSVLNKLRLRLPGGRHRRRRRWRLLRHGKLRRRWWRRAHLGLRLRDDCIRTLGFISLRLSLSSSGSAAPRKTRCCLQISCCDHWISRR